MANYRLQDATQLQGRHIFVDANILIYLFWPTGSHHFEQNYARVFRTLLTQGNPLYIDFLVISEVINRVLRIEHLKLNSNMSFKNFRDSQDGKDTLDDIHTIIKGNILNRFNVEGKIFNNQEMENLMVINDLDFVDKATVSLCAEKSLVLLTNDRDFKNSGLDILTGNPNILK